jgi:hypothetical protein
MKPPTRLYMSSEACIDSPWIFLITVNNLPHDIEYFGILERGDKLLSGIAHTPQWWSMMRISYILLCEKKVANLPIPGLASQTYKLPCTMTTQFIPEMKAH